MTNDEVNEWVQEVIRYVEGRFRLEDPGWELRRLHREALRMFIERVLRYRECKAIVQMPTGAGKSVLLAALAVACAKLREEKKLGDENRDVILVLAPLSRIKHQLHNVILKAGSVNWGGLLRHLSGSETDYAGVYHTALIGEEDFVLDGEEKIDSEEYRRISKKVKDVLNINDGKCKVILLNAQAIPYLKDGNEKLSSSVYDELLVRLLALFVDEVHFLYDPGGKLGEELRKFARNTRIALGFTATPLKECFKIIGASRRPTEGFLLGKPIHSVDLAGQPERIIIENLYTVFYRTIHKLVVQEDTLRRKEKEETDYWRRPCWNRVCRYVDTFFNVLQETYGDEYKKFPFKVLILAPNTREADLWVEILKNKLLKNNPLNIFPVFVAHTKVENAYDQIDSFVKSDRGFLVAVDMLKLGFDDPNLDVLVIARPIRSPVAYVQARGRVVRYPKNNESLKARRGALLIHFAFNGENPYKELENENVIKDVESGCYGKKDCKVVEISGYEVEDAEELDAEVVIERIPGEKSGPGSRPIVKHVHEKGVALGGGTGSLHTIEEGKKEERAEEEISADWKEVYSRLASCLRALKVENPDGAARILVKEAEKRSVNPLAVKLGETFQNFQELLDYWSKSVLGLNWKFSFDIASLKEGIKVRLEKQFTYDLICKFSINDVEKLGRDGLTDHAFKEWRKQYRQIYRDVSEDFVKLLLDQVCKQIYDTIKQMRRKEVQSAASRSSVQQSYQTSSVSIESRGGRNYIVIRIDNRIIGKVRVRRDKYGTTESVVKLLKNSLSKRYKDKESIINNVKKELAKILI